MLKYHLVNGKVLGVGYSENYNTIANGDEPFFSDWSISGNYEFINGVWELLKPIEPTRYIELELIMPDRAGYQRKVFINALPLIDFKAGQAIIDLEIKHYLNDEWVYNNDIQDKLLTLIADDKTRIPIDNEGNTWGEFQYFKYLFENFQVYFLNEISGIVQDRINSGLIDSQLTY